MESKSPEGMTILSLTLSSIALILADKKFAPRILTLDGGGVRGLSSLMILRDIMEAVQGEVDTPEVPRPCDYFDLIGGTSTGGLIAIMLGRLGMVFLIAEIRLISRLCKNVLRHISNFLKTYLNSIKYLAGGSLQAIMHVASITKTSKMQSRKK
jgi:hypothetical protein